MKRSLLECNACDGVVLDVTQDDYLTEDECDALFDEHWATHHPDEPSGDDLW